RRPFPQRHRPGLHPPHHPGMPLRRMGPHYLSQQQRTPHGRLALERQRRLERSCPSMRLFHRQHRSQRTHSIHLVLLPPPSRLCHQRRCPRSRRHHLLEEQPLPHQPFHRR